MLPWTANNWVLQEAARLRLSNELSVRSVVAPCPQSDAQKYERLLEHERKRLEGLVEHARRKIQQFSGACKEQLKSAVKQSTDDIEIARRAPIAADVYNDSGTLKEWDRLTDNSDSLPDGLKDPDLWSEPKSGFSAALYRNKQDGSCAVAFRGTRPDSLLGKDGLTDVEQAFGFPTRAYQKAIRLGSAIARHKNELAETCGCTNVEFVGHSLGAGLAKAGYAGYLGSASAPDEFGPDIYTYNAAELHPYTLERAGLSPERYDQNIHNVEVPNEVAAVLQEAESALAQALGPPFGDLDRRAPGPDYLPSVTWEPFHAHFMESVVASIQKQLQKDADTIRSIIATCDKPGGTSTPAE